MKNAILLILLLIATAPVCAQRSWHQYYLDGSQVPYVASDSLVAVRHAGAVDTLLWPDLLALQF